MATEIEKKYRVTAAQIAALRARLALVGAQACGTEFEVNTLYAGPGFDPRVCVLRLRRVGARAVLTYKERLTSDAPIKQQREDETEVADADALAAILAALGYAPALVYEKRRETWLLDGVEVVLDELPFGWFVEIEGAEAAINAAERKLELIATEVEHATYPELTARFGVHEGALVAARFEPAVQQTE
ncbi:MAG TPA: class IV adenylate cyclase [Pyrinomonadaceae bacterium]|jgi:adenylate cyclase class 2